MKRRGFLTALAALVLAPAAVLRPAAVSTRGIEHFIRANVWSLARPPLTEAEYYHFITEVMK